MRYGILLASGLSIVLMGATCFPVFDLAPATESATGTTLAVSVITPTEDRQVAAGDPVTIEWTAANLTGSSGVATVLVRAREDFADTILVGGLRISEFGGTQSVDWDTTGFAGGEYSIHVQVEAGERTAEATAGGRITLNTPPSFEFTEPTEDTELVGRDPNDPNDPNAPLLPPEVTIRWSAYDPESDGTAKIGIDPDRDHESGNEITIYQVDIPRTSGFDSIDWDGTDTSGERVEGDTYYLFAAISDEVSPERFVEGLARIIVPEALELAVTQPEEDTDFLTTDDDLTIEFTLDEDDDVFIDLRIDTDEDHRNGNETTILARYLVDRDTNEDSFDWDGDDSDGNPVGDGIYRIFMAVNRGSGSPQIVEAEGLVFRRSTAEQPLIALLQPDADRTLTGGVGGDVLIRWRDNDPSESAKIRLTIDDDATPDEIVETDNAEEVLPSGDWDDLDAAGDGVEDTFTFYVADDRAPGRYWIFAYIDRDEAAPWDNIAIAAGQIVVEDPDEPH
jgi:flagellar hook assembly protein FlgD